MSVRLLQTTLLPAALLMFAGCGGSNADLSSVTGTITLDGEPLSDAFVVFAPVNGGTTAYGRTDSSGYYEMMFTDDEMGAWIGVNRVEISTGDVGAAEEGGTREKVPVTYNAETTLTADVQPGGNTFDFQLKSAGEIVETMIEEDDEGTADL